MFHIFLQRINYRTKQREPELCRSHKDFNCFELLGSTDAFFPLRLEIGLFQVAMIPFWASVLVLLLVYTLHCGHSRPRLMLSVLR